MHAISNSFAIFPLMLAACHFAGWHSAGEGVPCVRASGGRLILSTCEAMPAGKQPVMLEEGLKAATITGCPFRGEKPVIDDPGADGNWAWIRAID